MTFVMFKIIWLKIKIQQIMSTHINRPVLKEKYDNYINGKWTAPSTGQYLKCFLHLMEKLWQKQHTLRNKT